MLEFATAKESYIYQHLRFKSMFFLKPNSKVCLLQTLLALSCKKRPKKPPRSAQKTGNNGEKLGKGDHLHPSNQWTMLHINLSGQQVNMM
jgi:hypothetical protein